MARVNRSAAAKRHAGLLPGASSKRFQSRSPRGENEAERLHDFKQIGSDLGAAIATSKSIAHKLAEINRTSLAFWKGYREAEGAR
jgi:hypothetical protein